LRRLAIAALVVCSTTAATAEMVHLLAVNGLTALEVGLAALFAFTFGWVALAFWTTVAGFLALALGTLAGGRGPRLPAGPPRLSTRTAILVPIYHEDAHRVFANIEAVLASVEATGQGVAFDVHVLSDSQDPQRWVAEEVAWADLNARHERPVFYRRRARNEGKKSGNIAEFCRRFGRHYDFFVVLDADSLMSGDTLVRMAGLMEASPEVGIIQAPPLVLGRGTPFAQLQHFASTVYGRVFAAGLAFWHLDDSNYWGHNAILRTSAFMRYCGLPELPGKPPFGGHILSHDFVEAALMRRAGYEVWLMPELDGSYEESPPTVLDYARRDERWCRGNLQHLAVMPARGLRAVSRLHLLMGVMSYVGSLLWLALILVGLGAALQDRFVVPSYFGPSRSLFPDWPVYDVSGGLRLMAVAAVLLWMPKLLGLLVHLWGLRERRGRALLSFLLESLWSVLAAPSFMIWHTVFVVAALLGGPAVWEGQDRDARAVPLGEAWRRQGAHVVVGIALGVTAFAVRPALVAWLAPVVLGLVLGPLLTVLSSSPRLARLLARVGLLETPCERRPPPVVAHARQLVARARRPLPADPLVAVVDDPALNALHVAVLVGGGSRAPLPTTLVASARRKLAEGAREALTREEERALLLDPRALEEAHLARRRRAAGARSRAGVSEV
jgi:membrane glycosyltransferase